MPPDPSVINRKRWLMAGGLSIRFYLRDYDGQWLLMDTREVELGVPEALYNLSGRQVVVLADQVYTAGTHVVTWDGADKSGRDVSSGTYMVRLRAGDNIDTRKITLVR